MTTEAGRVSARAVIKLFCDRFPQAFSRHSPRPLKIGVHADAFAVLGGPGGIRPRDLRSALRAYTGTRRYLQTLRAGAMRVGLDGEPAGTVTAEEEAAANARLTESTTPQLVHP